jgi:hypothetical protein
MGKQAKKRVADDKWPTGALVHTASVVDDDSLKAIANEPQANGDPVTETQIVAVDHGDLSEIQQAAEAWAGYLRLRAKTVRKELGALPLGVEEETRYNAAADRIDLAISSSRRDALDSIKASKTQGS